MMPDLSLADSEGAVRIVASLGSVWKEEWREARALPVGSRVEVLTAAVY
jgi:hypothetical protein